MCCLTHFSIWADVIRWVLSTHPVGLMVRARATVSPTGASICMTSSPSGRLILYPDVLSEVVTPSHTVVRKMARAGLLSCIFAQRCDVTAGETGNSWDYLTSTFHRTDLRMELIQGAIRGKKQEEPIKKGIFLKLKPHLWGMKFCSKFKHEIEVVKWEAFDAYCTPKNKHE